MANKQLLLAFLGVVALASSGWWYFSKADKVKMEGAKTAATRVTVARVTRQDVPVIIRLPAAVHAQATVAVKSRLDSQIIKILFKDGDRVEQGAVMFELDNRALKAQRAQQAANLQRDQIQLKNAKAQYERSLKLSSQDYVASEKLEQDKTNFEAQQAMVEATRAQLESLDIELDYTTIRAPIAGRAGTIAVTAGNNVKANDTEPLVTLNQIDPIWVQFAVPQRHYDALRHAMAMGKLAITATRPDSSGTLTGTLDYIDNKIDANNGTFAARASFSNAEEKLWPGMFVDVSLPLETRRGVLTIPAGAVTEANNEQIVFAVTADNKAQRRKVRVYIEEKMAIITDGMQAGEAVVTDGLLRVTDGAALVFDALPEQPVATSGAAP